MPQCGTIDVVPAFDTSKMYVDNCGVTNTAGDSISTVGSNQTAYITVKINNDNLSSGSATLEYFVGGQSLGTANVFVEGNDFVETSATFVPSNLGITDRQNVSVNTELSNKTEA